MRRLALRPSVLASVVLHAGALVGATALAAGRGPVDREAVVLAFAPMDVGAAFDAPDVPSVERPPVEPPPDELRIEDPVVVEPAPAEPPMPPEEAELPPLDEAPAPRTDTDPLPVPSPTARTRATPTAVAPREPAPQAQPVRRTAVAPVAPAVSRPLPPPLPPSVAQRAGAAQVTTLSRAHPTNRPPPYPEAALRAGWEGTTWLLVDVGADGRVANVVLERSSGHDLLDAAAVEAVATWTYDPRVVDGVPAPDRLRLPVRFTSVTVASSR